MEITRKYRLVWQLKNYPEYAFDKNENCFNQKTGKQLNRTIVNYSEGYCIRSKFKTLSWIRKRLEKI